MNDIINYIDGQIKTCIGEVRVFGLCHLLKGDNESFPSTVDRNAEKVIPDDRFLITLYHRVLAGNYDPSEELSFGRLITAQNNQRIRMVVFIKMGELQSRIDDIINSLPDVFNLDGYRQLSVSKNISLIRDRDAIWEDEYSGAYKDKYQMKFHIYAVEYDIQYIKCNACV